MRSRHHLPSDHSRCRADDSFDHSKFHSFSPQEDVSIATAFISPPTATSTSPACASRLAAVIRHRSSKTFEWMFYCSSYAFTNVINCSLSAFTVITNLNHCHLYLHVNTVIKNTLKILYYHCKKIFSVA